MVGTVGILLIGFGFTDQTIFWEVSALENTYRVLLVEQSEPLPWLTADVNNGLCTGLDRGSCNAAVDPPAEPVRWPQPASQVIRGLW
jgi:hypothetical protein